MQRSLNLTSDTKRDPPVNFMSVMKRSKKGGLQTMLKPTLGSLSVQRPAKFGGSVLSKTIDVNSSVIESTNSQQQEQLMDDSVLEGTKVQLFNSDLRPLKHLYKFTKEKPARKSNGVKHSQNTTVIDTYQKENQTFEEMNE